MFKIKTLVFLSLILCICLLSCKKRKERHLRNQLSGSWQITFTDPAMPTFNEVTFNPCEKSGDCTGYGTYYSYPGAKNITNHDFIWTLTEKEIVHNYSTYYTGSQNIFFPNNLYVSEISETKCMLTFPGGRMEMVKL